MDGWESVGCVCVCGSVWVWVCARACRKSAQCLALSESTTCHSRHPSNPTRPCLPTDPEGSAVLKELLQNADDAGAKRVGIVYDTRRHSGKTLYPGLAGFQGPAFFLSLFSPAQSSFLPTSTHTYISIHLRVSVCPGRSLFGMSIVDVECRSTRSQSLLVPNDVNWAGPAICAYNDAQFTAEDFTSICRIGDSGKAASRTKVGDAVAALHGRRLSQQSSAAV